MPVKSPTWLSVAWRRVADAWAADKAATEAHGGLEPSDPEVLAAEVLRLTDALNGAMHQCSTLRYQLGEADLTNARMMANNAQMRAALGQLRRRHQPRTGNRCGSCKVVTIDGVIEGRRHPCDDWPIIMAGLGETPTIEVPLAVTS